MKKNLFLVGAFALCLNSFAHNHKPKKAKQAQQTVAPKIVRMTLTYPWGYPQKTDPCGNVLYVNMVIVCCLSDEDILDWAQNMADQHTNPATGCYF